MSQQINLFNPIFLKQKKIFSAIAMLQALCLVLVGAMLLGSYARYRLTSLSDQAVATSSQLAQVKAELVTVTAQTAANDQAAKVAQEIQQKEAELKALRRVVDALGKGGWGNTEGYAKYFLAFSRQIMEGVWLTGFRIDGAGSEIALHGRALRPDMVPLYMHGLKKEPVMHGKSFASFGLQKPVADKPVVQGELAASDRKATTEFIEFTLQSTGMPLNADQAGLKK